MRQLAAAICSTEPSCTEYIVVISGDIANTGASEEYANAKRFLDQLADAMSDYKRGIRIRFLCIPGNHDCYLPENEVDLRTLLINGIGTTFQSQSPDESILGLLLGQLKAYFDFQKDLGQEAGTIAEKVCRCSEVELGSARIRSTLYNTAILSRRKETQGQLSVPMGLVESHTPHSNVCDLAISVFHHPYPWLQADVGINFRDVVERTSDLALTGHQHADHAYAKHTVTREHVFYSEGEVLQDPDNQGRSGFRVILIDFCRTTRRIVSYTWDRIRYTINNDTDWEAYSRTASRTGLPAPLPEFLRMLSDSVIGLSDPVKGPIPLEAIFVYPDANSRDLTSPDVSKNVGGDRLLPHLTAQTGCIVRGSAFTGKTALARMVAKEWLRQKTFCPILLSGTTISQANISYVDRLLQNSVIAAYGRDGIDLYNQLRVDLKAILIDDWDGTSLTHDEQERFIKTILDRFGKVVLFVQNISYIQNLLARIKGTGVLLNFNLVSLEEMSHVTRGQLIDRWLSLDTAVDQSNFARRVEETERLVQSVIGKNTLPSIPLIVLSILVAWDRSKEVLPENGSFGYLYEVLINVDLRLQRSVASFRRHRD